MKRTEQRATVDQDSESERTYSRRQFLRWAPIAVAGGFVLSVIAGRPVLSRLKRRRQAPVFPKGSIFTPAEDPRERV